MSFFGRSGDLALFVFDNLGVVVDESVNLVVEKGHAEALVASADWSNLATPTAPASAEIAEASITDLDIHVFSANDRLYTIPKAVQEEAKRALEWRKEEKRGGTPVGMNTARTLAKGGQIGIKKIRHIARYFPRHEVDKKGKGYKPGEPGFPSNGRIAWALWGGDAAKRWASAIVERDNKRKPVTAGGLPVEYFPPQQFELDSFKAARELPEEAAPDFMCRVRLDGSGVDRLYMVDADETLYVWDDGNWDNLGDYELGLPGMDDLLDDDDDEDTPTMWVPVSVDDAIKIAAMLDNEPFHTPSVEQIAADDEEALLVFDALPEIDWTLLDDVVVAAGNEGGDTGSGDGEYTPKERSANASRQVRDATGKFSKSGSRVVVGGDPASRGVITSINPDDQTVNVKLDNGTNVNVSAKATQGEDTFEEPQADPVSPDAIVPTSATQGILAQPRVASDQPNARIPGLLPPLTGKSIGLLLNDWPAWVAAERELYRQTAPAGNDSDRNTDWDQGWRDPDPSMVRDPRGGKNKPVKDKPQQARNAYNHPMLRDWLEKKNTKGYYPNSGWYNPIVTSDVIEDKKSRKEVMKGNKTWYADPSNPGSKGGRSYTYTSNSFEGFIAAAGGSDKEFTPETSDVPPIYMAIVADDDPQAVMNLISLVPVNSESTTPTVFRRDGKKWLKDEAILADLNSPTPPPVVVLDDETLASVLEQIDTSAVAASGYLLDRRITSLWVSRDELTAIIAAGGLDRNRGNAEKLRRYWTVGKGGAKIRWGTKGDWTRCVRNLSKYLGPRSKGYCFTGDTEFITRDGVMTFEDAVGTTQLVLTQEDPSTSPDSGKASRRKPVNYGGRWVEAPIQYYGEQAVLEVVLSRNGVSKTIKATPDHEWFASLDGRSEHRKSARTVQTKNLAPGMALAAVFPKTATSTSSISGVGVMAGFVYGDGHVQHGRGAFADLWGDKDASLLPYFDGCPSYPIKNQRSGMLGTRVYGMPALFKAAPSLSEGVPYLLGWLAGYIAADGTVSSNGATITISSASKESLSLVRDISTRLGIGTYAITETRRAGFEGREETSLYKVAFVADTVPATLLLTPEHRRRFMGFETRRKAGGAAGSPVRWTVVSVEDKGEVAPVYCAEVPDTKTFALADNIWVHNCALRHKEMTGMWTGDSRHRKMYGRKSFSTDYVMPESYVLTAAINRARVADAKERIHGVTAGGDSIEGATFFIPLVIPEELESGDGRKFAKDAIDMRDLPLPLMWQIKSGPGHDGSVVVGKITHMERTKQGIGHAYGVFDAGAYGREAERLVRGGFIRGVSADLDRFEANEEEIEASDDETKKISTGKINITKARVMAVTLVPKPAFQECRIEIVSDVVEQEETVMEDGVYFEEVDPADADALVACGVVAGAIPVTPPAEWFENPKLKAPMPLTVDDNGRVFGHIAAWHVDHIGMSFGTRPPRSASKYAYFHTGVVRADSGKDIPVGQLTLAGGHASLNATASEAVRHYDDTASAIADVHAGEDGHGIWVAGALRPGTTPEQVRALRASAPSGDWRPIKGKLELVAVCQVNVPGFPIARARVASGEVLALVAAGAQTLAKMRHDPVAELQARIEKLEQLQNSPLTAAAEEAKSRFHSMIAPNKAAELSARVAALKADIAPQEDEDPKAQMLAVIASLRERVHELSAEAPTVDELIEEVEKAELPQPIEEKVKYTAKTQPRDARGRFRQVLARIKMDLGTSGNADALEKIEQAENLDFAGDYEGAVKAAQDLLEIVDRIDTGALNPTSLENVRESAGELGKVIANLPFAFGDEAQKIRYSDIPPALRDLIDDMIDRVERKIGREDADIATETLKKYQSGGDMMNQGEISSEMSKLLRLLT